MNDIENLANRVRYNRSGNCGTIIEFEDSHIVLNALENQINDRWIPVSERLPADYQRLIVCTKSNNLYLSRVRCNEFVDIEYNPFNDKQENTICDVIAWKPLPTPFTP